MPECYLSTGCFQTSNLDKIISLSIEHYFNLELSSALPFLDSILKNVFLTNGKLRYLVHNYFPSPAIPFVLNLASTDPLIHRQSVKLCKNAINLCARLGAPFYSVHAGFALNLRPKDLGNPKIQSNFAAKQSIPREAAYGVFVTTVNKLALYATARNVGLLVENNVVACENMADDGTFPLLLADVAEIKKFFKDLRFSEVGLLLDVGHAKVSAKTLQVSPQLYFDELEPFIKCLHLSENDGCCDSNRPFNRNSWFFPFLKKFEHVPVVIEVYQRSLAELSEMHELIMNSSDENTSMIGADALWK
ncbi:MAG: sugar phosphate isomerase/epimerase family protein [Desulfuromonadaceae bacterium]